MVPFITSKHSATSKIAKYLDRLLRPFANEHMTSGVFYDEADFIQRLNNYVQTERHLTPTTLFCRIKITNYHTLDHHKSMIDAVTSFIQDNVAANRYQDLSINTIKNLLQLALYNNLFYYKNQIYVLTKGIPNTMSLSDTLANIYLYVWQNKVLKKVREKKEFLGR